MAQAPTLRITADSAHGEIVAEVGPLHLGAGSGMYGMASPPTLVGVIPVDGWMRGYNVELLDAAGHRLPQTMVHHVNLMAPQKRELFSQIMLRIGAAGAETSPVELPRLLGYHWVAGDSLLLDEMLMNPTKHAYDGVRLRVHMPFVFAPTHASPVSIYPFYMDVMPPAGIHAYDLQPGISEKSWDGRPAIGGRILGVGGHLHKYGIALRFTDVTAGTLLWEAKPDTDATGEVVGFPRKLFLWTFGLRLHPDHVYRVTAVYRNPTGKMIPDGAMGTLGGVIIPDRPTDWPAIDRNSAEYRDDLKVTYDSTDGMMGAMGSMEHGTTDAMHDGTQDGTHGAAHDGAVAHTVSSRRPAQSP